MNVDKTKVVCIGKKKHSSDKICLKWGLEWGSSRFKLLGIHFSTNLEEMEDLNYYIKFQEIENCLKSRSKQLLTPIGKMTVVKT